MRIDPARGPAIITRGHRDLLLVASAMTGLLVTLGGIVCVTGASRGCPDWPACYGQLVPPMRLDSILEYSHRVMAALTSILIITSAIVGCLKSRSIRWVSWPPMIAVALLAVVVILGAVVVLRGLEPGLAALDLGSALLVLALMVSATATAFSYHRGPDSGHRVSFRSSFARLTLWTLVSVFVVLVSGVLVASSGSLVRCLGWPRFGGQLDLTDARGWLQLARLLLAGVATILVIATVLQARHRQAAVRRTAAVVAMLFLAEALVALPIVVSASTILLHVASVSLSAAFWTSLVVLVMHAGLAAPSPAGQRSVA